MHRSPLSFVSDSVYVEFASDYPLTESVERLRNACVYSVLDSLFQQAAVGIVSIGRVRLQRVRPLTGNAYKPFFNGSFHESQRGVVLCGRFAILTWIQVLVKCEVWLATVATALSLPEALLKPAEGWKGLAIGVAMAIGGVISVKFGQWLSRHDVAWLSCHIEEALKKDGSPHMWSLPDQKGLLSRKLADLADRAAGIES